MVSAVGEIIGLSAPRYQHYLGLEFVKHKHLLIVLQTEVDINKTFLKQ